MPHQPPAETTRRSTLYSRWLVVAAFALTVLGTTLPTPMYVLYQNEFGFSTLMITIIFATYGAGVVAALLLCGHLSDQVGRRRVLLPGLALSAASSLLFLFADSTPWLFPARLLSGLSAGLITGTATAAILDLGDSNNPGRSTMTATVTQIAGLGLGPLLGGLAGDYLPHPLRLPFIIDIALLLLMMAGLWAMPEPSSAPRRPARLTLTPAHIPAPMRAVFLRSSVAGFAGFAVLGLFTAIAPSFLRDLLGHKSLTLAGAVICAVFYASAFGQIVLVPLAKAHALALGCAGLVAGMLGLAAGFATSSFTVTLLSGLLAGLGQGMSFRSSLADVNAHSPRLRRADIASTYFVILYVALALPVVGVGLAAEIWGLRTAGIAFSLLVAALALAALLAVTRANRRAHPTAAA